MLVEIVFNDETGKLFQDRLATAGVRFAFKRWDRGTIRVRQICRGDCGQYLGIDEQRSSGSTF